MKKAAIIAIVFSTIVLAGIIFFGIFFTVETVSVRYENDVTSTDKQTILSVIDINAHTNIFSVNESNIKQKVESSFSDNSIEVTDVVRSVPNKVTVVVRERTRLFKIERIVVDDLDVNKKSYVAPDKDFQRNTIYSEEELAGLRLIEVEGLYITDSFAVKGCYILKDIANSFIEEGFTTDSLPYFVLKITFEGDDIVITLFDGATFTVSNSNVKNGVKKCYSDYIKTNDADRAGKQFA